MKKEEKMKKVQRLLWCLALLTAIWLMPAAAKAETEGDWSYFVLNDGTASVSYYKGSDVVVTLPTRIAGYQVTVLGRFGSNANVEEVIIPSGIKKLGDDTFNGCTKLKKVTIPATVQSIGQKAFYASSSSLEVEIDGANPYYKFENKTLFSKDGKTIWECLTSKEGKYVVPEGVTTLADNAFFYCGKITEFVLPTSLTSIGESAFYGCWAVKELFIPKNVSQIGRRFIEGMGALVTITVDPANQTYKSAGNVLFTKDGTTLIITARKMSGDYVVPDGVTLIKEKAFSSQSGLTSVKFPSSLKKIEENAFAYCSGLTEIILPEGLEATGRDAFCYCSNVKKAYVPSSLTTIDQDMFYYDTALEEVVIAEGFTKIGYGMFNSCNKLKVVILPESLEKINGNAFLNCGTLDTIVLPQKLYKSDSIAKGSSGSFNGCGAIKNVYFTGTNSEYQKIMSYLGEGNPLSNAELHLIAPYQLTIIMQPQNTYGKAGDAFSFDVWGYGQGLSYQWQVFNGSAWANATEDGNKTRRLQGTIPSVTKSYRCKITNSAGKTVYSNEVVVSGKTLNEVLNAKGQSLSFETLQQGVRVDNKYTAYPWVASNMYGRDCAVTTNQGIQNSIGVLKTTITVTKPSELSFYYRVWGGGFNGSDDGYFTINGEEQFRYSDLDNDWTLYSKELREGTYELVWSYAKDRVSDGTGDYFAVSEVKVSQLILFTKQPKSVTGYFGDGYAFSVAVNKKKVGYQWQLSKDGGSTWEKLLQESAGTATLKGTINDGVIGNLIRCRVSDKDGHMVYSDTVTVTEAETKLVKEPGDFVGYLGDVAAFTVEAKGSNLTYQWQQKKDGSWVKSARDGAKTNTLSFTITSASFFGQEFRCAVKDRHGKITYTKSVTLKQGALPDAPVITKQPTDWTGTYGKKASFTVEATGDGLTYQWQYRKDDAWNNYDLATADTANFKVTMNERNVKWELRCVITDRHGRKVVSSKVRMKLAPMFAITKQPADWTGTYGKKASFNVEATGEGLTYQWQYKKGSGAWTDYAIATADTANFRVTMNEKNVKWAFRCVITDATGKTLVTNEVWMRLAE